MHCVRYFAWKISYNQKVNVGIFCLLKLDTTSLGPLSSQVHLKYLGQEFQSLV